MKTFARLSLIVSFFLLVFVALLLASGFGLQMLQKSLSLLGGGAVVVGTVEGKILGQGQLTKFRLLLAGAEIVVDDLSWDWHPAQLLEGALHVASLEASGVVISLRDEGSRTAAAVDSGPLTLPKSLLPLAVVLDRLAVTSFRLEDSDGSELIVFDRIDIQLENKIDHLSIGNLSLQGPEIGIALHGSVDFTRNWHIDLLGNWRLINYGFNQLEGTLSAVGPLASPHDTFAVNRPADIRIEGDVADLLHSPRWTATLLARDVDLEALIKHCPKIDLATVNGQLSGDVGGYRGLVQAVGTWGTIDKMQLRTDIEAGLLGIDFKTLRIDHEDGSIVADNAKINWKRLFDWEGLFHVKNFDPSDFFPWLPGRLSGDLTSVGTVRDDLGVDVVFEVFGLAGTLRERPVSAVGKVTLTENDVRTENLIIRSGEVEGSARIDHGMLSWADDLSWSGEIHLHNFDPSGIAPAFPGRISGLLAGKGVLATTGAEGFVKISDIEGELRGNILSGSGEISLMGETFHTDGLYLQSGGSQLTVQGQAGEGFALDFNLTSADLGEIFPESKGAMRLLGKLRGSLQAPQVDIDLAAQDLGLGESRFQQFKAKIHTQLGKAERLQGSLVGEKMLLAGLPFEDARIDFSGSLAAQDIEVQGSGEFGRLQLRVRAENDHGFRGEITNTHFVSSSFGNWRQHERSVFALGGEKLSLENFCLSEGEGTACLGGELQLTEEGGWRLESRFSALSLNWLNRLKFLQVPVSGLFAGEIAAAGTKKHLRSAKAEVNFPETTFDLGVNDEEFSTIRCQDSRFDLSYADSLLQTSLVSNMKNGSSLTFTAATRVEDLFAVPIQSLPLSGTLAFDNFDLSILSVLTEYGVDPTGRVRSSFTLGGTVGRPELVGEGHIDGGGISLPYQGITLENISVALDAAEDGAKVVCRATSGSGDIRAEGRLRYGDAGVDGDLHIQGKNFLLVDLPEYSIRVNPDVHFLLTGNRAAFKGAVQIPHAMLAPEEMKDSVAVSKDVILVNGRKEVPEAGWPVSLDLDVSLGDEVRIDGYGLTGRLAGDLQVKTVTGEFPTAQGELDLIDGVFSLYGRTLDIERGRVLFTGGPIDNPGVDVRAQKKFSEEAARDRGYTVGVDISGLVQDLSYHLFSDPYMDDTEILSQMIVGRSLAFSNKDEVGLLVAAANTLGLQSGADLFQGLNSILQIDDMHLEGSSKKENVSLVVGKRLTKDLYIGYDVNMFSQLGQFRVRYDLTRGFAVETRSSSQSTGADLIYSFEK